MFIDLDELKIKILVASFKGGVGKSALSYTFQQMLGNCPVITTDRIISPDTNTVALRAGTRTIPKSLVPDGPCIFDMGGMIGDADPRIVSASKMADVIIIPTLTDVLSVQATIMTYRLMESSGKPIFIIVNNFIKAQMNRVCEVESELRRALGPVPIFQLRQTTLYRRVLEHGNTWSTEVFNQRGVHRLRTSWEITESVLESIILSARK